MAKSEGWTDEDIGRPGAWEEGRYQQGGRDVDQSVRTPAGTSPNPKTPASSPVTRQDYEPDWEGTSEPPGGDAG